jgi:hypothetical protein
MRGRHCWLIVIVAGLSSTYCSKRVPTKVDTKAVVAQLREEIDASARQRRAFDMSVAAPFPWSRLHIFFALLNTRGK